MSGVRAYTRRDFVWAVNVSAVLGWLVVAAPTIVALGVRIVPWAAILGLPVAFAACWTIGAPILWRLMARPITWLAAALWGVVITTLIASAGIAIGRWRGWRISKDDSFYSKIGGGEFVREVDGILTPYGWWMLAQETALFIAVGTAVALVVRAVIGPGGK